MRFTEACDDGCLYIVPLLQSASIFMSFIKFFRGKRCPSVHIHPCQLSHSSLFFLVVFFLIYGSPEMYLLLDIAIVKLENVSYFLYPNIHVT